MNFIKLLTSLLLLTPLYARAASPALEAKAISCRLMDGERTVSEQTVPLISLVIEDHLGRFAQVQFGNSERTLQYQILIEEDLKSKDGDGAIFLQNFRVDSLESSAEFSAKEVRWIRIAQGTWSVWCDLQFEIKTAY